MAESKLGTELMAPTYRGEITPFITIGSRPPLWCFFFPGTILNGRDNFSERQLFEKRKATKDIQAYPRQFICLAFCPCFFFWTTNTKKKGRGSVIPPFFTSRFSRTPIAIDLNNDGKVPVFFCHDTDHFCRRTLKGWIMPTVRLRKVIHAGGSCSKYANLKHWSTTKKSEFLLVCQQKLRDNDFNLHQNTVDGSEIPNFISWGW